METPAPSQAAAGIIFLTGRALMPSFRAFLASVPNVVLKKPFPIEELVQLVASRLRRGIAGVAQG
jgi:hypothetical protein